MLAITGATGFVGRALSAALTASGAPFRGIGRSNAPGLVGVGEIGPETDWREALQGVTTAIHLAARVHQMRERDADLLQTYRHTNVAGTLQLARQAHAMGVKRLVFVSSIKVNGERTAPGRPFRADDAPHPLDPYAVSKLEAEQGLWKLAAETGLEVVVVRPPLVYGAGVGANFRALVSLALRGVPLPLAAIRNKRSLIAVDNLADLLIRCATGSAAAGRTLLCCDGEDLSTPELMRAIGRASGQSVRLFPVPPWILRSAAASVGQGAAGRRLTESLQVDMSDTEARLAWTPPFSMAAALAQAAACGWVASDSPTSPLASRA